MNNYQLHFQLGLSRVNRSIKIPYQYDRAYHVHIFCGTDVKSVFMSETDRLLTREAELI